MLLVRNLELKKFERDVKFIQMILCMSYLAGLRSRMSGYWPRSFLRFYPDRGKVEVNKNAENNEANLQPS